MIDKRFFPHIAMLFVCFVILASCALSDNRPANRPAAMPGDSLPETSAKLLAPVPLTGKTKKRPAATATVSIPPAAAPELPTSGPTDTSVPKTSAGTRSQPSLVPPVEGTATDQPAQSISASLPPEAWKSWPITPQVSAEMRAVYQQGLARGNDPHAFSIIGDCQSQPKVFMGVFDKDPGVVDSLAPGLQDTVTQFAGSFNRYSPTVKDGSTEGAMLWVDWNDNKEGKCNHGETPIDCELRVHRPSIVLVHVGTHYEARNRQYLTILVKKIIESGAVPVMVTKADDRELDERINLNIASVAAEFNLPLWNFWSSVQHLDNRGLRVGSNMYLSKESEGVHRIGALETLHTVWQALRQ